MSPSSKGSALLRVMADILRVDGPDGEEGDERTIQGSSRDRRS
jgi:hypothetical protein